MPEQYFIIDFDSTFIQTEGLEELAEVVLKDNPKKEEILEEIKKITNLGMEGKIGFRESLKKSFKKENFSLNFKKQKISQKKQKQDLYCHRRFCRMGFAYC